MPVLAPFAGTVVAVWHERHASVSAGQPLVVLEAMKMEHEVLAEGDGILQAVEVVVGDTVEQGQRLAVLQRADDAAATLSPPRPEHLHEPSDELETVRARHAQTLDAARPDAVAKRHKQGRRTARENLADLIDPGSFVEYGPLMFAAQERRRPKEELIARTPADGLVAGTRRSTAPRPSSCPTTTRSSPAPRGCATISRRTGCSSSPSAEGCPWSCSPRAVAGDRAMSTGRTWPASTAGRSTCSRS